MCNLKKLTMKFYEIFIITTLLTTVQSCGPGRGIGVPRRIRKLTPLVFKQHLPNLSENTLGASGLQEEKISREHPKFQRLVPNYNRDIIFRDEEGTGADRLMSERCKEKLNTLAMSVMNQWPGVRVRVIEAWDEDDYHGPDSLHYEGRAVDITTSDRDRSKYGMLARLAVEAGFDWVYYESRAHIHCSVKSDSSQASHITGCFTGDSTVQTSTGETRRLSELQIGEHVLSVNTRGEPIYSEVIMFLDREETQQRDFVKIQTDSDATIVATPAHLLLVWNRDKQETSFMFAAKIQEDDYLFVNINGTLEPRRVKHISSVVSKGVFAPLTKEGTVVVDSIAASCYALINSQSIAHWSFLPYRTVRNIIHWFTADRTVFPRDIGIHPYAKFLYDMKDYVIPTNWLYSYK